MARTRATRSTWPTAYCGRPPPHRCTCVSTGTAVMPASAAGRPATARPGPRRSPAGSTSSPCATERGAQDDARRRPASRTQSPLGEGEGAGLDRALLDRRHQEAGPVDRAVGEVRAAKASVTTATLADSIAASSAAAAGATSASRRAVGAAGVASTTAARLDRLRRAVVEPTVSAQPVVVTTQLAHGRVDPDLEAPLLADQAGQPAHAAGQSREDRGVGARHGRGLVEQAPPPRHGQQLRNGRGRGDLPGAAGVDATEQRLDQAVDHLVAEARRDEVADRDVVRRRPCRDLGAGARESVGESARRCRELLEVERHPHQRARHRAQRAARPDAATWPWWGARPRARAPRPGRRPRVGGRASPRRRRRR